MDLGDVAKRLNRMVDQLHEGLADGIHKTAVRVQNNAKKQLGHYQSGWATLQDESVRRKKRKNKAAVNKALRAQGFRPAQIKRMKNPASLIVATGTDTDAPLVDDGLLRASITIQMDRGRLQAEIGSPMEYAAAQEFGAELNNLPARPYLRPALQVEIRHLKDDLADGVMGRIRR